MGPFYAQANACTPTESFYHLGGVDLRGRACRGLACFAARARAPTRWLQACERRHPLYCLGQCYAAPALFDANATPPVYVDATVDVLLSNIHLGGVTELGRYRHRGGGIALAKAVESPQALLTLVETSGLRGRGGAGFPTGRKWRAVAAGPTPRYLVVNADEGDPGAFSDRLLLEGDPFRLIEAATIAAIAIGAEKGFIYLRREYPTAVSVMENALAQVRAAGWLGEGVLGSCHRFDLELRVGRGSFLCGEETALLNALEHKRPEARARPPLPAQHGLWGAPTLVNNVETLCAVPWIVEHGAAAYAALGSSGSAGTKLLSLNSLFCRPGLYEVEFGIPLRDIVERLGGGLRRGSLLGLMIGGPLAALIPPRLLDTPLDYEALRTIGAGVGHGGVVAFDDNTDIAGLAAEVFHFGAFESCGRCTPCALGAAELARLAQRASQGEYVDGNRWRELVDALAATSLCGHGRGLAEFAAALQRHYPEELSTCFA